jgi:NAD-reducing hydrogenase large subunit
MNLAQIVQSHALSFFHLSSPDLLLGFDSDPARRNIFGVMQTEPELARRGIRLRQFGQEIIETLGGKKIHPAWAVPGGVRSSLTQQGREHILSRIPEALETARIAIDRFKGLLDRYREEAEVFGNFPTLFMGLVGDDGSWEHYGGRIRFVDAHGDIVADGLEAKDYRSFIAEAVQGNSYLKSPYYRPMGLADGVYRVGPLARLNVCTRMNVERADAELSGYRDRFPPPAHAGFLYHYARLIEILGAIEHIARVVDDAELMSPHIRAQAGVNQREGIGVSEAPRGTLFHHYQVDEHGLLQKVNLVIATGQNNLAMNRAMVQIARHYIKGPEIPEGVLNRMEAGIRSFDPCLSCSTHAIGMMPLHVRLVGPDGSVCAEAWRN